MLWKRIIDTGVLYHNATVADTKAKLEATQITFDATQVAAADAVDGDEPTATAVRVGDVLKIELGGGDNGWNGALNARETISYIVQIKSVSDAADPVCVFTTAIDADIISGALANDDGMTVHIMGRTQNPRSRCSSLFLIASFKFSIVISKLRIRISRSVFSSVILTPNYHCKPNTKDNRSQEKDLYTCFQNFIHYQFL